MGDCTAPNLVKNVIKLNWSNFIDWRRHFLDVTTIGWPYLVQIIQGYKRYQPFLV